MGKFDEDNKINSGYTKEGTLTSIALKDLNALVEQITRKKVAVVDCTVTRLECANCDLDPEFELMIRFKVIV